MTALTGSLLIPNCFLLSRFSVNHTAMFPVPLGSFTPLSLWRMSVELSRKRNTRMLSDCVKFGLANAFHKGRVVISVLTSSRILWAESVNDCPMTPHSTHHSERFAKKAEHHHNGKPFNVIPQFICPAICAPTLWRYLHSSYIVNKQIRLFIAY